MIRSLTPADGVRAVTLLANGKRIPFEQRTDGLHLRLPVKPVGESAYVFRIDLSSPTP